MIGWHQAPEVEWDRMQRRPLYTPDVHWGSTPIALRRRDRRRPFTRFGRALGRLLTSWQLWVAYCGAITGVALFGSCAPAYADDPEVFTAPAKQYAAEHHTELCADLQGASVAQIDELLYMIITRAHFSPRQAAEAAYYTALQYCPATLPFLDAYANQADPVVIAA